MTLLDQLPRLSPYDPGASGEGSLDPMGLAPIAERMAELLVPGLRARMSLPRFVTLTAVGAVAVQSLVDEIGSDGSTTADLAYEWLVVSALVQSKDPTAVRSLPGSRKARRALNIGEGLNAQTYLRGPRVFGFTGVHRPFSVDAGIIDNRGLPLDTAASLVLAWEKDTGMDGFFSGPRASRGGNFRRTIEEQSLNALKTDSAPKQSRLYLDIQRTLLPSSPGTAERAQLHRIVMHSSHEIRNTLSRMIFNDPPPQDIPEHEIAAHLLPRAPADLRVLLYAMTAYEECATVIDRAFRDLVRHMSAQTGSTDPDSLQMLIKAAQSLPALTQRAIDTAAEVDNHVADTYAVISHLSADIAESTALFHNPMGPRSMFDALLERHRQVQESKDKLMWLDQIKGSWITRSAYRNQPHTDSENWIHPMRLSTLQRFVDTTR
ncbi:hypothetical protein [Rhodococcus sp. OK302]|uniref:hypothetical protein n=1 Tax=Rhodococcus sp. OK302 TaxID=1882769 RepID=UPI000B942E6A|nr:hypothetical protein [Rhodococcus sp. OK302]OYD71385.1 hypothetical protein BDB13_5055 [Rhodococcus sp. OK302]